MDAFDRFLSRPLDTGLDEIAVEAVNELAANLPEGYDTVGQLAYEKELHCAVYLRRILVAHGLSKEDATQLALENATVMGIMEAAPTVTLDNGQEMKVLLGDPSLVANLGNDILAGS